MNKWILHPFLVPTFPVFSIYLVNLNTLSPSTLIRSVVVLEIVSLLSWAALTRLFRNTHAAAVTVSLLMLAFFVRIDAIENMMLGIWFLLATIPVLVVRKDPTRLAKLSAPLNVVVLTLLLLQGVRYFQSVRHASTEAEKSAFVKTDQVDPESLPHIMHIILDGFGSPDLIHRKFGADLQFMVNHLHANGFSVADQARSNYMQTMQSLASTLSLNYLPGSAEGETNGSPLSRTQLSRITNHSPVHREMRRLGYRVEGTVITAEEIRKWCSKRTRYAFLSTTEEILLKNSCLGPHVQFALGYQGHSDKALRSHYTRVKGQFETGTDFVRQEHPVCQILHIISPHPPFVFAADGSYRTPDVASGLIFSDASHFLDGHQSWEDYESGYGDQVQWVAAETCRLVDRILSESKRPVAIIIQGDHGPGLRHSWSSSEDSDVDCRSSILLAIRLPNQVSELAPDHQSPVNIYRFLFNKLWGAELPLLPKHVYYSTWNKPNEFEEVTARLSQKKEKKKPQ